MAIKGLQQVMTNLHIQIKGIEARSVKGLVESSLLIRRETETISPITPVDLGNLRASYFTVASTGIVNVSDTGNFRNKPGSKKPIAAKLKTDHASVIAESNARVKSNKKKAMVSFGYTANYAAAVHEKRDAEFQRPGAGPKWFEAAIKRNKKQIVELIKKNAKLK